ncbi:MAG: hypothetical protein HYZ37_06265 [Candidatus Solibacter usitatus]|nr:hypothetical protein [Candidatus Solibacter usitatus]
MRRIRYGRFTPEDIEISSQDLLKALASFLLRSGYDNPYDPDPNRQLSFEELRHAIQQALFDESLFEEDKQRQLREMLQNMTPEEFDQLAERLAQQLIGDGLLRQGEGETGEGRPRNGGIEITDKSIDFLGFHTLRNLLGSLGRSSFGAHDTRDMASGIEASGASQPYQFGDTMNLDISATLFSAMRRDGAGLPLQLEYEDLHIHQSEYRSSCATVLMLDCSHSMILYGEDRFTPAKQVALALAHLIRTQFPGDTLRFVLFHDSAEEVRLAELAQVQVGPWYTNTRDGLILAQRLLEQERKDMKQIIMITDGKPSALTLEDGRMYRNAFGLDPLVITRTLEEVGRCKRRGILINTFMLANDYDLVKFVQQVTELCRGKAYFTSPYTLGEYLLYDYMNRKTRTVH